MEPAKRAGKDTAYESEFGQGLKTRHSGACASAGVSSLCSNLLLSAAALDLLRVNGRFMSRRRRKTLPRGGMALQVGMQVAPMIQTGEWTLLSCALRPFSAIVVCPVRGL